MTPTVAVRTSNPNSLVATKPRPAASMSRAPTDSTRRLPSRSARVVSHSEMIVSPIRVRLSSNPI